MLAAILDGQYDLRVRSISSQLAAGLGGAGAIRTLAAGFGSVAGLAKRPN